MSEIKINRDKKDLSDEQILKHKNFDAVMNAVSGTAIPWYKTTKFWLIGGTASVIVLVVSVVLMNNTGIESEKINDNRTEITPVETNEPEIIANSNSETIIESTYLSRDTAHVSLENRIVKTGLGSALLLPEKVYINENEKVSSLSDFDVWLTYHEISDSIYLRSYEKRESFQIDFVTGEGVGLFLGGNQKITIDSKGIEIMEETGSGWLPLESISSAGKEVYDTLYTLQKPEKASSKSFLFDESYGTKEKLAAFKELATYENVAFLPVEAINQDWYDTDWTDFEIEKINQEEFKLILVKGSARKTCKVRPVFLKEDYQRAMEVYEASYTLELKKSNNNKEYFAIYPGVKYAIFYL